MDDDETEILEESVTERLWLNIGQYIRGPGKKEVAQFHVNLLFCSCVQSEAVQMVYWQTVSWKFFQEMNGISLLLGQSTHSLTYMHLCVLVLNYN